MTIQIDENRKKKNNLHKRLNYYDIRRAVFFINNYFKITERDYRVNISNYNIESSLYKHHITNRPGKIWLNGSYIYF